MLGFERCLSLSAHIWEMRIVVVPTPEAAVMAGWGGGGAGGDSHGGTCSTVGIPGRDLEP